MQVRQCTSPSASKRCFCATDQLLSSPLLGHGDGCHSLNHPDGMLQTRIINQSTHRLQQMQYRNREDGTRYETRSEINPLYPQRW